MSLQFSNLYSVSERPVLFSQTVLSASVSQGPGPPVSPLCICLTAAGPSVSPLLCLPAELEAACRDLLPHLSWGHSRCLLLSHLHTGLIFVSFAFVTVALQSERVMGAGLAADWSPQPPSLPRLMLPCLLTS